MIVSFTVTNHRSFSDEQTFSMVASHRITGHEDHLQPIPGQEECGLPAAILYGANGAGKSNLIQALKRMRDFVVKGVPPGSRVVQTPFLLKEGAKEEPTSFEIRAVVGGRLLEYGFRLLGGEFTEEWLVHHVGRKEITVFERGTAGGLVSVELGKSKDAKTYGGSKLASLADVAPLPNQLFLRSIATNLRREDQGELAALLIRWFHERLVIIAPGRSYSHLPHLLREKSNFQDFALRFLRNASTGVRSIAVKERKLSPVPPELSDFMEKDPERAETMLRNFLPGERDSRGLERQADGSLVELQILTEIGDAEHRAKLPFSEQSDGTRRLTHLLPALFEGARDPHVIVVDEIDRSLHPLLARQFIESFLALARGRGSQLILTTHDTNLLDLDLFRRDEIWFVEKKPPGETHLYSLAEFKVRLDLRIDNAYLQGRFGAIPFLGGIERMLPNPEPCEKVAESPPPP